MNKLFACGLFIVFGAGAATASEQGLAALLKQLHAEVNSGRAMEYMRRVYETDRWFTFPKFEETAAYLERAMREAGLKEVRIARPPADGVTQFGYWTMPLAWDAREARLEVLEPAPPEEFRLLADYRSEPASLAMWSGPTPPGGVVAEVVDAGDASPRVLEQMDLKGKLVLTSRNPAGIKWLLAKKGALGAINAFTENPDLKDGRHWINAWGDKGWGLTKGDAPLVGFSITPRQAEWLRKALGGGRVRVRAEVDSRYYEGAYPYVTGFIPGAGGAEEVLTLGHTSETGAQDNATGVAAMLEGMAALERLIAAGRLPRPRRGIRMLAMGELYGSMHYIAANPERIRNTIAAICLDTPAGFYHLAGTEYTFHLNPHVAKSYVDAFTMRLAEMYFSTRPPRRPFHEKAYTMGTDSFLGDPTIGVPTVWPYSGSGVHTHHNSEDTPDDVDPRSLKDLTVVNAAFLYFLASAGEPEARWLAEVSLTRGYRQVLTAGAPAIDRVFSARDAASLARLLHDGLEKLDYSAEREMQAVESARRLAPGLDLSPLAARLRAFAGEQAARLREAVDGRAAELGLKTKIQPAAPPADPKLEEAARLVVRRKRFGSLPLDDLPHEQREGWPSGAWDVRLATALYWCDGKRNLAEVIRLTRLELGPLEFDFTGYFKFLARRGYVELVSLDAPL